MAGEEEHHEILEAPRAKAAPECAIERQRFGRRTLVPGKALDGVDELRPELGLVVVLERPGMRTRRHRLALRLVVEIEADFFNQLLLIPEYVDLFTDLEKAFDARRILGKHERTAQRNLAHAALDLAHIAIHRRVAFERRAQGAAREIEVDARTPVDFDHLVGADDAGARAGAEQVNDDPGAGQGRGVMLAAYFVHRADEADVVILAPLDARIEHRGTEYARLENRRHAQLPVALALGIGSQHQIEKGRVIAMQRLEIVLVVTELEDLVDAAQAAEEARIEIELDAEGVDEDVDRLLAELPLDLLLQPRHAAGCIDALGIEPHDLHAGMARHHAGEIEVVEQRLRIVRGEDQHLHNRQAAKPALASAAGS